MIVNVPAGAAVRVFLKPPATARAWRLLRKQADTFTGPTDADATLVHAGTDRVVLDDSGLLDGFTFWYRAYYWTGSAWVASASVSATPQSTYVDESEDALSIVRDRLDAGMLTEVARQRLRPQSGTIDVLTASPVYDDRRFPMVTVHLQDEGAQQRFIGENPTGDEADRDYFDGSSDDTEGWLAQTQLTIMGWSLNSDERKELRKAIRRILVANLPVFDAHGLLQVEFRQQDTEDFTSYNAPVYQVMTSFTCLTPIRVSAPGADLITDVVQTFTTPQD